MLPDSGGALHQVPIGVIRFDEICPLPEFLVQFGDVAEIDVLVLHLRELLGSQEAIVVSAHGPQCLMIATA